MHPGNSRFPGNVRLSFCIEHLPMFVNWNTSGNRIFRGPRLSEPARGQRIKAAWTPEPSGAPWCGAQFARQSVPRNAGAE